MLLEHLKKPAWSEKSFIKMSFPKTDVLDGSSGVRLRLAGCKELRSAALPITTRAGGRAAAGAIVGITVGACTMGGTSAMAAAAALALTILSASAFARSAAAFILTKTYVSVQYLDCLTIYC
jgi:hypothetical protein